MTKYIWDSIEEAKFDERYDMLISGVGLLSLLHKLEPLRNILGVILMFVIVVFKTICRHFVIIINVVICVKSSLQNII